jgi:hypothetical protein
MARIGALASRLFYVPGYSQRHLVGNADVHNDVDVVLMWFVCHWLLSFADRNYIVYKRIVGANERKSKS